MRLTQEELSLMSATNKSLLRKMWMMYTSWEQHIARLIIFSEVSRKCRLEDCDANLGETNKNDGAREELNSQGVESENTKKCELYGAENGPLRWEPWQLKFMQV